nr:hypothetical protein [Tanacetum cinerariifolium]
VPIIPDPEPFNNQTIKELPPTVQSSDPKSDLVHNSPNVFNPSLQPLIYSYEFCGNDAYYGQDCSLQVLFTYDPEPFYNQDFNFPQNFQTFQQYPCCTRCGGPHETCQCDQLIFDEPHCKNYGGPHMNFQCQPMNQNFNNSNSSSFDQSQPPKSLVIHQPPQEISIQEMKDLKQQYLDEMKRLINSNYRDETQIAKLKQNFNEKIFSNPLFDEEIIPMKIDQHHYNAESDLIESMGTHDSSIIISSKIDSFLDEFAGELTLLKSIPPRIDETDCDFKDEIHLVERLLYDNSSPRPPEEFVSENSDAEIESFSPSPIPEDNDSLMEEIDLTFTPDCPMPPSIKDDNYDSKRDILILKDLLSNDTLSLPEIESFHFDIPSFSRPPAKPPNGNTGILNVKMMGDISNQKVPIPKLMITLVSNQEKSHDLLSHRGLKTF